MTCHASEISRTWLQRGDLLVVEAREPRQRLAAWTWDASIGDALIEPASSACVWTIQALPAYRGCLPELVSQTPTLRRQGRPPQA